MTELDGPRPARARPAAARTTRAGGAHRCHTGGYGTGGGPHRCGRAGGLPVERRETTGVAVAVCDGANAPGAAARLHAHRFSSCRLTARANASTAALAAVRSHGAT